MELVHLAEQELELGQGHTGQGAGGGEFKGPGTALHRCHLDRIGGEAIEQSQQDLEALGRLLLAGDRGQLQAGAPALGAGHFEADAGGQQAIAAHQGETLHRGDQQVGDGHGGLAPLEINLKDPAAIGLNRNAALAKAGQGRQGGLQLGGGEGTGIEGGGGLGVTRHTEAEQTGRRQAEALTGGAHGRRHQGGEGGDRLFQGSLGLEHQGSKVEARRRSAELHRPADHGAAGRGQDQADHRIDTGGAEAGPRGGGGVEQGGAQLQGGGVGGHGGGGVGDPLPGQGKGERTASLGFANGLDTGQGGLARRCGGHGQGGSGATAGGEGMARHQRGHGPAGLGPLEMNAVGVGGGAGVGGDIPPADLGGPGAEDGIEGELDRFGLLNHGGARAALGDHLKGRDHQGVGAGDGDVVDVATGHRPNEGDAVVVAGGTGVAVGNGHLNGTRADEALQGLLQGATDLIRTAGETDGGGGEAAKGEVQHTGGAAGAGQVEDQLFVHRGPGQHRDGRGGDGARAAGSEAEGEAAAPRQRRGEPQILNGIRGRGGGGEQISQGPTLLGWQCGGLQGQAEGLAQQVAPKTEGETLSTAARNGEGASADGGELFQLRFECRREQDVAEGLAIALQTGHGSGLAAHREAIGPFAAG